MKKYLLLVLISIGFYDGFAASKCTSNMSPFDFKMNIIELRDSSFSINWIQYSGAVNYKVKLIDKKTKAVMLDSTTSITAMQFGTLKPKTFYTLTISARCSNGNQMANIIRDIKTLGNTIHITNFHVDQIAKTSARINWNKFGSISNYRVLYRLAGTFKWNEVLVTAPKCVIKELLPSKTYEYKVGVNYASANIYSQPDTVCTFTTLTLSVPSVKPNVLVILMDDARQDVFQPDGGPVWFQTPGISRIANEGLRFKNAFVTQSICSPSRASIYSGLYPHNHGLLSENLNFFSDTITTIASVLHKSGYYTGVLDKYGINQSDPAKGWDYWHTTLSVNYFDQVYNIDGYNKIVAGHRTDITNADAFDFLNSKPANVPFMLFMNYRAPHAELEPRYQDTALFDINDMTIPSNFAYDTTLYPSYLYPECAFTKQAGYPSDTVDLMTRKRKYFQLIKGADDGINALLNHLDSTGQLNNTLVIFTSDNGYFLGEHYLNGKRLAYEESLRVPMYVRYPAWFSTGTVENNRFASNIDIFPTILDATGISNSLNLDGKSLYQVYTDSLERNYFYYEYYTAANVPCIKAIRTNQYKYIRSYCNSTTEEFYDLQTDSLENFNLITDTNYTSLIESYRLVMDSTITALNDTTLSTIPCSLVGGISARFTDTDNPIISTMNVFPVPATDKLNVQVFSTVTGTVQFVVKDVAGKSVEVFSLSKPDEAVIYNINLEKYKTGIYFLFYDDGVNQLVKRFLVENK